MLKKITDGIWVHQSECLESNTTIIKGKKGVLLVDPGLTSNELISVADDLSALGLSVAAGFSTHPHWDHVLWHERFGDVPRYATQTAVSLMQESLSNPNWKEEEEAELPEEIAGQVPLDDLFGQLTALAENSTYIPWDGPKVKVIEHSGHAPGHAALYVEDSKVLIAGDMLSDVFMPMLNLAAQDPSGDYLSALDMIKDIASSAEFVIPGHGSVGDDVQIRINQDQKYVQNLLKSKEVDDSRITSPKQGWEWVADIHNWQSGEVARKLGD